jgi:hypothetical protein
MVQNPKQHQQMMTINGPWFSAGLLVSCRRLEVLMSELPIVAASVVTSKVKSSGESENVPRGALRGRNAAALWMENQRR